MIKRNILQSRIWKFNKREIRSLAYFSLLVGMTLVFPILIEKIFFSNSLLQDPDFMDSLVRDSIQLEKKASKVDIPNETIMAGNPDFLFDPNDMHTRGWEQCGLAGYKIHTILKYLSKGGHFYTPKDIRKIYSLNEEEFKILEPHIRLNDTESPSRLKLGEHYKKFSKGNPHSFVFNSQNSWKISLNRSGFEDFWELRVITKREIWDILNFRKRNGAFSDIRELKNLKILDLDAYTRLQPHLILN